MAWCLLKLPMEDMFTWTEPTVVIHHTPNSVMVLSDGVRRDRFIVNVPLRKFPNLASGIAVETSHICICGAAGNCKK